MRNEKLVLVLIVPTGVILDVDTQDGIGSLELVAIEKSDRHVSDIIRESRRAYLKGLEERFSLHTEGDVEREKRDLAVFHSDIWERHFFPYSSGLVFLLPHEERGVKELLGREVDATAALEEARNQ